MSWCSKLFLPIFLMGLLLSSCKKEDNILLSIEGVVTDNQQNSTVQGADITLQAQFISSGVFSNTYETIGETTSNSNGYYAFSFERENVASYRLRVRKEGYFPQEKIIEPDAIVPSNPYQANISFPPLAYFELTIKNTSPFDNSDKINYRNANAEFSCECCNNELLTLFGEDVDTSFGCPLVGAYTLKFNWNVTKDGVYQAFEDSVFCAPNDTTHYSISY